MVNIPKMEALLRQLGLSEYEAKVYLALVQHGSLSGAKLSKLSSVPQSKIYEVLYRLAEKKFVSILEVRPKSFKAVEPRLAIQHYLQKKKEELEKLEGTIPEQLEKVKPIPESKAEETITIYRGEKYTHPLVLNKFVTAQKYVKEMFTFEYLPAAVEREIKKCLGRGIKIKMLATLKNKENIQLMRKIKKLGVEIRYYPLQELRLAIKDGLEAYQMIVNPKNLLDRISMVIESKELTRALEHYFDYLWKKALSVK